MEHFDFKAPAEVFVGRGRGYSRMAYLRFGTGAEAIRHVVERQDTATVAATVVGVDGFRFDNADLRALYESLEYPLPRNRASLRAGPVAGGAVAGRAGVAS